jgi:hypothetical protein
MTTRVFLVDDHEIVRTGLRDLLEATRRGRTGRLRSWGDVLRRPGVHRAAVPLPRPNLPHRRLRRLGLTGLARPRTFRVTGTGAVEGRTGRPRM